MFRSPKRIEYPSRSVVLPRRHGAPDASGGEVDVFIADQRSPVQRSPMVVAADGFRIQQVDATLLACVGHEFPAVEVENGRRHLHVQIALPQPRGVRRAVVVHKFERLGLRLLLDPNDPVAKAADLWVEIAVARSGVHDAGGADGWAATAPHAAARGTPTA